MDASSAAVERTSAGDVHMWMYLVRSSGVPTKERGEIGRGWLMYSNLDRRNQVECQIFGQGTAEEVRAERVMYVRSCPL